MILIPFLFFIKMTQDVEEETTAEFCSLDTSLIDPFLNPPKPVLDFLMTRFGVGEALVFVDVQYIIMLCFTHFDIFNNSNMMQDGLLAHFNNLLIESIRLTMSAVNLEKL